MRRQIRDWLVQIHRKSRADDANHMRRQISLWCLRPRLAERRPSNAPGWEGKKESVFSPRGGMLQGEDQYSSEELREIYGVLYATCAKMSFEILWK